MHVKARMARSRIANAAVSSRLLASIDHRNRT
jgi:hypothetical protein